MEFKASLDSLAKWITSGVSILFIVLTLRSIRTLWIYNGDTKSVLIHSGMVVLFAIILLISWMYAPKSYVIYNDELIIKRAIADVRIKIDNISQVSTLADNEGHGTIRTFGVSGLFGYFGRYYNSKIGHFTLYATQRKNKILIVMNNGNKIIITPDEITLLEKIQ